MEKKESRDTRAKSRDKNEIRVLVCNSILVCQAGKWRKYTLGTWTIQTLKKLPTKRALVNLRLCNCEPQLNALLPSGSVYFLNINSRDRFKACLEIKHIIM